jgi:predicted Rossmann-fold nucleotide-binding protein
MGTLDETCEMLTWAQLGLHAKPCGLLNVEGYYDAFLMLLDRAVAEGFLRPQHRAMVLVDTTPDALLDRLASYVAPNVEKWLSRSET